MTNEEIIQEKSMIKEGTRRLKGAFQNVFRVEILLLLFSIAIALVMFGETIYGSFLNLFLRDLQWEYMEIGVFFFVFSLTGMLVSIPAGYISDRIGRNILTVSLFILAAVVFSYTLAQTRSQLLLLRALHGAISGFMFPIARAYVMDKTTEENRGQAMGTFVLITTLAGMAAPLIGGFLRDQTGNFSILFYIGAIFPVLAALFLLTRVRDMGTGFAVQKMELPTRELISNKVFLTILLMFGMLYFATGILAPILGIFAVEELGMSTTLLGTLFTLMTPLYAVSQFVAGSISDRLGRKRLLVYPLFIYAVAVLVAGLSRNYWLFFIMYLGVGIGAAPYATVAYSLTGDVVRPKLRGTASGAIIAVGSLGTMIGNLAGPAIGELANLRAPFILCSFMVFATIAMLFIALPRDKRGD